MTDNSKFQVANVNGMVGYNGLGYSVDQLDTSESTLTTLIVDESGSMFTLRQATIDAINDFVRSLADGDGGESLLGSMYTFNDKSRKVYSYKLFKDIIDLTLSNYNPSGGTALYDSILTALDELEQYSEYLKHNGQNVRQVVFVITDGEDSGFGKTATAVKTKINMLLKQETYTIILLGVGEKSVFEKVAKDCGINVVLNTGSTPHEFRQAVGMASKSISKLHTSQVSSANSNNAFLQP